MQYKTLTQWTEALFSIIFLLIELIQIIVSNRSIVRLSEGEEAGTQGDFILHLSSSFLPKASFKLEDIINFSFQL